MTLRFCLFIAFAACALAADAPVAAAPDAILKSYAAATQAQDLAQSDKTESMIVDISASVPRLKKEGKLHALRTIFARKKVTYGDVHFEGDNSIKTEVIGRYLTAEVEAQQEPESSAVTPANYKFAFKGKTTLDGRSVYVFDVTPRKKRDRLFKGQVWIDAETYLLVQEQGKLVKKPSMWMRNVAFTRKYDIRDGFSVPLQMQTTADVVIFGKVEMTIDFSNFSLAEPTEPENR